MNLWDFYLDYREHERQEILRQAEEVLREAADGPSDDNPRQEGLPAAPEAQGT